MGQDQNSGRWMAADLGGQVEDELVVDGNEHKARRGNLSLQKPNQTVLGLLVVMRCGNNTAQSSAAQCRACSASAVQCSTVDRSSSMGSSLVTSCPGWLMTDWVPLLGLALLVRLLPFVAIDLAGNDAGEKEKDWKRGRK